MTNREFLEKSYTAIENMKELYTEHYYMNGLRSENMEIIFNQDDVLNRNLAFAMAAIRHNVANVYKDILVKNFYPYNRRLEGRNRYMTDNAYLCDNMSKCVRKFNGLYYVVNVKTPIDEIFVSGLLTESPDDYCFHNLPYIGYNYPEEAMLKWYFTKEGLMDEEISEYQVGNYDDTVESYLL